MQCKNIQSQEELRSAVDKGINNTLSTIPGCHTCQLKQITVPGCESKASNRKRKSVDHGIEVLFSLLVFKDNETSSSEDNIEEKSEAVLFQMQYAVAAGQFMISLHGMNSTADRSTFQHLSSKITCSVGSVSSNDGKGCGKH